MRDQSSLVDPKTSASPVGEERARGSFAITKIDPRVNDLLGGGESEACGARTGQLTGLSFTLLKGFDNVTLFEILIIR